jgi:hypothetical protein
METINNKRARSDSSESCAGHAVPRSAFLVLYKSDESCACTATLVLDDGQSGALLLREKCAAPEFSYTCRDDDTEIFKFIRHGVPVRAGDGIPLLLAGSVEYDLDQWCSCEACESEY